MLADRQSNHNIIINVSWFTIYECSYVTLFQFRFSFEILCFK